MKIFVQFISIALLLVSITGCEDFLDKNLQGEITQDLFPTTPSDALLATNAAYSTLREWHYNSGGYPILDIMSDDSHKGSNPDDQLATLGSYDNFQITPTQDGLDRWWNTLYKGIKLTNVVIELVPDIQMDESLKNRYIAEARFLRGLYYFDLVRAWGGVPKVVTLNPPLKLERSSANEIYDLIISDLLWAIEYLPPKSSQAPEDIGRATRGAAHALLAKAYLFQNNFVSAKSYALKVIKSGEYDLEPAFADANGQEGEHGVESVFEVGALEVSGSPGNQYANTQGVRGTPNRGWGFNQPSVDLRNSFEPGDPRRDATIIELGEFIDGIEILGDASTPDEVTDEHGNVVAIESYNQKVWIPGTTTINEWGHNRRLIRYADVLLMAAECLNETSNPDSALIYLNMVRERAREGNSDVLPDITESNKDLLRSAILHERRVELALEGHRFYDLVRTGKAPEVLGKMGFIRGKHELFPIPQTEIDISQGTLAQNPNWE